MEIRGVSLLEQVKVVLEANESGEKNCTTLDELAGEVAAQIKSAIEKTTSVPFPYFILPILGPDPQNPGTILVYDWTVTAE